MGDEVKRVEPAKNRGGTWITFGAEEYRVPPLGLGAVRELQDRIAAMANVGSTPTADQMDTVFDVVHAALKRNYPEITREAVADMVDLQNYQQVLGAVLGISGFTESKGDSPGEVHPSIGTTSTSP